MRMRGTAGPRGGDSTQTARVRSTGWEAAVGDSSHGDGSEFDDEGMQSDDPGAYRRREGNSGDKWCRP